MYFRNITEITPIGKESDLLEISIENANPKIAREFINKLVNNFDKDGIVDRQLVFKRTIDFVDSRFDFLKSELLSIEDVKENYKKEQNLSYIEEDASISIQQKITYDSELFQVEAQLELSNILKNSIHDNRDEDFIPVNIGLQDDAVNNLIAEYNLILLEKNKLKSSAGENNIVLRNYDKYLFNLKENVLKSLNNYNEGLSVKISTLKQKENESNSFFSGIPRNEKMLRSIEREQEIKEALFLLLLQKREEAAINFAVTKPSIKIIDKAITNILPVLPKVKLSFLLAIILAFIIPTIILYVIFLLDTKIHTREQLTVNLNDIPIIAELPTSVILYY